VIVRFGQLIDLPHRCARRDHVRPTTRFLHQGERLTLRTARQTQALVIAAVDRLARNSETRSPRPLGRIWGAQLDLAGILVGEPVDLVDNLYGHARRLVELHQEFVHRTFEALDVRELPGDSRDAGADVILLSSRLGS
jgi:hypothetical protein